VAEGSGGNAQDCSADYPLMQLRSLESGQTAFFGSTNWWTNSFTSLPVWNLPAGYALATAFVNGIQSTSAIVNLTASVPTAPVIAASATGTNGAFGFAFTNSVGALFGIVASTNLSLPLTSWTAVGTATEAAPGKFQFWDSQATNNPQRFYRIFSP